MQVNNEITAAAERLKRFANGLGECPMKIYGPNPGQPLGDVLMVQYPYASMKVNRDRATLANAYLADLDARRTREAEGAKAVTEEWLRSIGFTEGWFGDLHLFQGGSQIEYKSNSHGNFWRVNSMCYELAKFSTRDQLLQLLAALNLQPKVGA